MATSGELLLFFLIVLGVVLLPGLDFAYVAGSSLSGGLATGLAAVAGIVVGGFFHVAMGTAGISAIVALRPEAFDLLLVAGALYLAWIGRSLLFATTATSSLAGGEPVTRRLAFRRGLLTNLLNPKAYAFTLAILPQYLRPDSSRVWLQACVLSGIIAATQIGVYGSVALLTSAARSRWQARPTAVSILSRAVGLLLIAGALYGVLHSWRPIA